MGLGWVRGRRGGIDGSVYAAWKAGSLALLAWLPLPCVGVCFVCVGRCLLDVRMGSESFGLRMRIVTAVVGGWEVGVNEHVMSRQTVGVFLFRLFYTCPPRLL